MNRCWIRPRLGFTVLEMVVFLSVLAIFAATAALSWPALASQWRFGAASRQLLIDLQQVRSAAVARGNTHRIILRTGQRSYSFQSEKNGQLVDAAKQRSLPKGVYIAGCSAVGQSITFRADGQASSFGTITLADDFGRQRRIVVDIAGRMRIF